LTAYLVNRRARQTYPAADEQHLATGRLLVNSVIAKVHRHDEHEKRLDASSEDTLKYQYRFLKPNARGREYRPEDSYERAELEAFVADRQKNEGSRWLPTQGVFHYYGAIRVSKSCLGCHPRPGEKEEVGDLGENDLMAVVRISIPSSLVK
jgi:hypothetical protein